MLADKTLKYRRNFKHLNTHRQSRTCIMQYISFNTKEHIHISTMLHEILTVHQSISHVKMLDANAKIIWKPLYTFLTTTQHIPQLQISPILSFPFLQNLTTNRLLTSSTIWKPPHIISNRYPTTTTNPTTHPSTLSFTNTSMTNRPHQTSENHLIHSLRTISLSTTTTTIYSYNFNSHLNDY